MKIISIKSLFRKKEDWYEDWYSFTTAALEPRGTKVTKLPNGHTLLFSIDENWMHIDSNSTEDKNKKRVEITNWLDSNNIKYENHDSYNKEAFDYDFYYRVYGMSNRQLVYFKLRWC